MTHDRRKEFLYKFWLNGGQPEGYNNRYVHIDMFLPCASAEEERSFINRFEDILTRDDITFAGAMYGEKFSFGNTLLLTFDINKGCVIHARALSMCFPEAVVYIDDTWDDYNFSIWRNGVSYEDFTACWENCEEPMPYENHGAIYYDCNVVLFVNLPWTDDPQSVLTGGGMLTYDNFLYYKEVIDRKPAILAA